MAEETKQQDKTLSRLTKQVNQTIEISDILAGKKDIGGKLGQKLKKQKVDESSLVQGKKIRGEKFKEFDKYLERLQTIANRDSTSQIKIERALIADPKNPGKLI